MPSKLGRLYLKLVNYFFSSKLFDSTKLEINFTIRTILRLLFTLVYRDARENKVKKKVELCDRGGRVVDSGGRALAM